MTDPIPAPRDPWAALARHLTRTDPWRTPAFVQPPPMPADEHDDQDEVQPA